MVTSDKMVRPLAQPKVRRAMRGSVTIPVRVPPLRLDRGAFTRRVWAGVMRDSRQDGSR